MKKYVLILLVTLNGISAQQAGTEPAGSSAGARSVENVSQCKECSTQSPEGSLHPYCTECNTSICDNCFSLYMTNKGYVFVKEDGEGVEQYFIRIVCTCQRLVDLKPRTYADIETLRERKRVSDRMEGSLWSFTMW